MAFNDLLGAILDILEDDKPHTIHDLVTRLRFRGFQDTHAEILDAIDRLVDDEVATSDSIKYIQKKK